MTNLADLLPDWEVHLRARNKRRGTIDSYLNVGRKFLTFLQEHNYPTDAAEIKAPYLERHLAEMQDRVSPSTVGKHYRSLQQLVRWLVDEDEMPANIMERMRPPAIPEQPVDVLTEDEIKRLLATCRGKDFTHRRDEAIMRLLLDTGMRASELIGLTLEDVDRTQGVCYVEGKGGRGRVCPFGSRTSEAISRYLRARARLPMVTRWQALWVGTKGPLTDSGLRQLLERRGIEAQVRNPHPHRWRHTFSHRWLAAGGAEQDLMSLAGWRTREMLGRYGASAAASRAREAHRRLSLGDEF